MITTDSTPSIPHDVLLKEVHHRMKNHMSTLVGLFTLQSAQSDDERVRSALSEASSRAASMMVLYDRLYQQSHAQSLEVARFLPGLVNEIVRLFACCHDVEVSAAVDEVSISARQAQPLTLLVNEIVTNAMKHAFDGAQEPRLHLSFSCPEATCILAISDNGKGSKVEDASGASFGMDLIQILVDQLGGRLEVTVDQGTTVTVRFDPKP